MKSLRTMVLAGWLIAIGSPVLVQAASLEGIRFADQVRLAGVELPLNGLGLRGVMFIKGYVAGLYLPRKVSDGRGAMAMPGPKRIELSMLRSASAEDFNKALASGVRDNALPGEWPRLVDRLEQLRQTVDAMGAVRKGDVITMDFIPEQGLQVTLNGVAKGAPIPGADFFNAVLAIFVGDAPVDARLKRGLLGLQGS